MTERERPGLKAIFDALTGDSSTDSCDPDWCGEALAKGGTESEVAHKLDIWPY